MLLVFALFAAGSRRRGSRAPSGKFGWSEHDMRQFVAEIEPLGVPLEDSLLVYAAESALDPRASSGVAYGIPQLTQIAAKQIGWTRPLRDFGTLSVANQAPWIARLQASQIRQIGYVPANALELAVANFSPKAARERSTVIYRQGTDAYAKNSGLDSDHKGFIAPLDLDRALNRTRESGIYKQALALLEKVKAT